MIVFLIYLLLGLPFSYVEIKRQIKEIRDYNSLYEGHRYRQPREETLNWWFVFLNIVFWPVIFFVYAISWISDTIEKICESIAKSKLLWRTEKALFDFFK